MKLKKLEVKNYRSLKDVVIEFGDLTILIGKNDAGKSNVLKALDLFFNLENSKDIIEGGGIIHRSTTEATTGKDPNQRLFFNQKYEPIQINVQFELDDTLINDIFPEEIINVEGNAYRKDGLEKSATVEMVVSESSDRTNFRLISVNIGDIYLLRSSGESRGLSKQKDGIHRYDTMNDSMFSKILTKIKGNFLMVPAVRELKKETKTVSDPSPKGTYIPSHYFRLEKDTSLRKKRSFNTIKKGVSWLFPGYENIESMEDGNGNVDVYFGELPSESVGEGVRQGYMNIFTLHINSDKICGIEEPEIHFNPKKQREVFGYLKEQSKKRQIIITTHSPIFVSSSNGIKTHLIRKDKKDGATYSNTIKEREDFKRIKWEIGARNTDLFFYNCVVLIEGDTEDKALPIIADAMGHDLFEKGIRLVNIRGSGNIKRTKIKEFLEYLKDSDVIPFVIIDNDENVESYVQDLVREGLLGDSNYKIWKGEFEDSFGEEKVLQAMKELAKEKEFKFDVSLKELRAKKKELEKPISKVLRKILREKELPSLNKPMLGEKLAFIIEKEINGATGERKKTEPEKTIGDIIKIVESQQE